MSTRTCTRGLLFLSLAANIFFIGFFLTHAPEKRMPPYMRLESQLRHLPEPQKSKVDAVLAKYHPNVEFKPVEPSTSEIRISTLGNLPVQHSNQQSRKSSMDAVPGDPLYGPA